VLPLLTFTFYKTATVEGQVQIGYVFDTINVYAQNTKQAIVPVVARSGAFKWLYIVGCFGLLARLLYGFIRLGGLAGKVKLVSYKGYKVADLPGQFNPFSFFNIVFVNQSRYSEKELEQIMIHELTHVRLKHSWDVLLLELLLIIQWFNPFAWLLRSMLKELHEFQADKQVLNKGYSAKSYKELLLFQATGARLLPVNNFNQSLTKKRFTMMRKSNLQKIFGLKSVFAIVTISMVAVLFACELREVDPVQTQEEIEMKEAIENASVERMPGSSEIFFVVENMPEFPKGEFETGEEALRNYIATEVKYPKVAQEAGESGRVYVTFIVGDDGQVRDSKIARGSGFTVLDEEALRVVSAMPKWTPGKQRGKNVNVSFTVPINFSLNGETQNASTQKKGVKFEDMTEEQKNQIIEQYREKGWEVSFNENGSLDMKKLTTDKGTATPIN